MTKRRAKVVKVHPVDHNHQVVSLSTKIGDGIRRAYRKTPCGGCPWKKENDGLFPAEAFRISAKTAYDMAQSTFACHESGQQKPADCAGFLLHGSEHNMAIRLALSKNTIDLSCVSDGGYEVHESYREMAVANGVDPEDEVLTPCR